jgi:Protein of unknown function (DUF3224)
MVGSHRGGRSGRCQSDGRRPASSFILQHSGTMTRSALEMTVSVVPDSGTDQLARIPATMTIN